MFPTVTVMNIFTFSTSLTIVFNVTTPSGLSQVDSFIATQPRLMNTVVLKKKYIYKL